MQATGILKDFWLNTKEDKVYIQVESRDDGQIITGRIEDDTVAKPVLEFILKAAIQEVKDKFPLDTPLKSLKELLITGDRIR